MSEHLSPQVTEKIREISSRARVDFNEAIRQFMLLYKDPFVQKDPHFTGDEERYRYCLDLLKIKLLAQPSVKEYIVIPFGITDPIVTKGSGILSRIYIMHKSPEASSFNLGVLVCRGQQASLSEQVQLFTAYRVKMSPYGSNLFFAGSSTVFQNPQYISQSPLSLLEKIGVKNVTLNNVHNSLSRREGKYIDEFDLRGIRGYVLRWNTGKRPSGSNWAVYSINDGTITEDIISPDGKVVPVNFTVWIPHRFLKYDVDSELYFVGTVQTTKDNEVFMNAIYVYPIHPKMLRI